MGFSDTTLAEGAFTEGELSMDGGRGKYSAIVLGSGD